MISVTGGGAASRSAAGSTGQGGGGRNREESSQTSAYQRWVPNPPHQHDRVHLFLEKRQVSSQNFPLARNVMSKTRFVILNKNCMV
jgi:hypothetical protein